MSIRINMSMGVRGLRFVGLALMLAADTGYAVTTSNGQVDIQSRVSEVDFNTGVRTYTGNVHVTHANLELRSAELTEYRTGNRIDKVVATGAPVRFTQAAPFSAPVRSAVASRAEYRPAKGELRLWDYTVWDTDGNKTRGKRVLYRFAPR